jgi:hypothetical protein
MSSHDIELKAPKGKLRVIGFAVRDDQTYLIGDFETLVLAEQHAKEHGHVGNPVHIYNDAGQLVIRYGSK